MSHSSSPTMTGPIFQRPPSALSVASNSSSASGVSLTRRARVRSKTITGNSSGRDITPNRSPISELPYLDRTNVREPSVDIPSSPSDTLILPPTRLPHSPEEINPTTSSVGDREDKYLAIGSPAEDPPEPPEVPVHLKRAVKHTADPPEPTTSPQFRLPPSAFSRHPSLTRINATGANVRDSILTQNSESTEQSGVSSSLYPPSTSTASGPESPPFPCSILEQDIHYNVSSFDPDVDELQEYDRDDVSYRLRLLVKNNYFLPPAHSKPSPSDFASNLNPPKRPARATTPTFLDFLRVGKSKSKPPTPTGPPQAFSTLMPVLRTTSDSTTASGHVVRSQPRSSAQIPRLPPRELSGRVVVVREKMNDLSVAAKQSEQDMKARSRREHGSQKDQKDTFNDVIDPTDVVDIPPPSSSYPFAAQASAMHGLGVQDSVGAAVLADRLPPPTSPNASSYETDVDWRKALLQEAVHHSLDTSPDLSSFSMMLGAASTPLPSPRISSTKSKPSEAPTPGTKRMLEQRIIKQPLIEDTSSPPIARKNSTHSQSSAIRRRAAGNNPASPISLESYMSSHPSSFLPLRADTPSGPMTPLTPPPRRHFTNPLYSLSQTDLTRGGPSKRSSTSPNPVSPPALRKAVSSPMLSDSYESNARQELMMTPPPMPRLTVYSRTSSSQDLAGTSSFETSREHLSGPSATTSESHYSDDEMLDEAELARASIALSALDGRPSLSSQPSPTTSAFRDAPNYEGYLSTSSSLHHISRDLDYRASTARDSRYSAMSPPPRISSSLAHIALSPPPRSSSFHHRFAPSRASASTPVPEPRYSSSPTPTEPVLQILAPEPTTPPLPISERRGNPATVPLSLNIPSTDIPIAIHSAPGPSSPTAFFDSIQSQPNAMDDLESSDESDDGDEEGDNVDPRGPTNLFVDPRTRAISQYTGSATRPVIMRLGNHSTPYIRPNEGHRPSLPFGVKDPKQPISHIPVRAPFFAERTGKSDQGHGISSSTMDFYRYTQDHPSGTADPNSLFPRRRPATADQGQSVAAWRSNQQAQESLKRLDGMLIQHMETEKDTIKRIATTVHSNSKP